MLVIGLTGSIASGKSMVSSILEDLGAKIIDADKIARKVVLPGTEGLKLVISEFGGDIIDNTGALDRRKLGEYVFSDEDKLKKLNEILHPLILTKINRELNELKQNGTVHAAVLDAPLLIECGLHKVVDEVWLVIADDVLRLQRLMKRDGLNEQQARARMLSQLPQEEKLRYADIIIENNGKLNHLRKKVKQLYKERMGNKVCG